MGPYSTLLSLRESTAEIREGSRTIESKTKIEFGNSPGVGCCPQETEEKCDSGPSRISGMYDSDSSVQVEQQEIQRPSR